MNARFRSSDEWSSGNALVESGVEPVGSDGVVPVDLVQDFDR